MIPYPICALPFEKLQEALLAASIPAFRTKQIYHHLYQRWVKTISEAKNLPKSMLESIQEQNLFFIPEILKKQITQDADTQKFLLALQDGKTIETVLLYAEDRVTQCLSTQVGCPLQCAFCATGNHGFVRNLETQEIIGQVQQAVWQDKLPDSFVFMGMGEPFLNEDAVFDAIEILHHEQGAGIGYRRFTISTVGIFSGIERLVQSKIGVRLAISLNSPFDEQRSELMPINKKYPLKDLLALLQTYQEHTHHRLSFEYVLIKNVNTSIDHAKALLALLKPLNAWINIIPFNPFPNSSFERPSPAEIERFIQCLGDGNIEVVLRYRKGDSIAAACGQLTGFSV